MPRCRHLALALAGCLLLASPPADAVIFTEGTDSAVVVTFQFAPTAAVEPWRLLMNFPSSLVPPTLGYTGCILELYDEGGLISSSTITSIFGCNAAFWFSDGGTGVNETAGTFIDLSGIAAGEQGTIFYTPTFLPPPGPAPNAASLDPPNIQFTGVPPATILSLEVVPEPALGTLALAGLAAAAWRLRRRCR